MSGRDPDYTYAEVGATRGEPPPGYRTLRATRQLGRGRRTFSDAAEMLMSWTMHRRAGLVVTTSSERVVDGARAVLGIGLGPARLRAPVKVVYVVNEPDRQGFAYGTLPGHPESGEERFVITISDDVVEAEIAAFSRPGGRLTRLAGPVGRSTQRWVTARCLARLAESGEHDVGRP